MSATARAEPITVMASWQLEATVEHVGRYVTLRARALDELRAPLPSQPVVIRWTSNGQPDMSQVYMTDRDGLLVARWTLDDGDWAWSVSMPEDPWAVIPSVDGAIEVGGDQISFTANGPVVVAPGTAPWSVDLTATTGNGARARMLDALASLDCGGDRVASSPLATDSSGRATWSSGVALQAGQRCSLRVELSDSTGALTADSIVEIRALGSARLTGSLESGDSFLGLTSSWQLDVVIQDENGPLPVGQFEALQQDARVGLWPASDEGPFPLSSALIDPNRGPLTIHWVWSPLPDEARVSLQLEFPADTGMWRWMGAVAGGTAAVAGLVWLLSLLGARARMRAALRTPRPRDTHDLSTQPPGLLIVDSDTGLPLHATVLVGDARHEAVNGRWTAPDATPAVVTVTAAGYETLNVASDSFVGRPVRVELRPWRRQIIDQLLGVLVEQGIQGAAESWWGRRSPSNVQPDALVAVRGLRLERESEGGAPDWRAIAHAPSASAHESLRALFALVDEAAFGPPERLDETWVRDARTLADRIRQLTTSAGAP